MPGFVENWQKNRRQKRIQKITVVGPKKDAGINMGRESLSEGLDAILAKHREEFRSAGVRVKIHMTSSLDELDGAKEEMMREEPGGLVVLFGGDGNTHWTLGQDKRFLEYLTSDPDHASEVTVLKRGTKNVVPTALKLLGDDQLQAFDVLCQKIARGIPRDIVCCPILKINELYGFIYGAGLVVNALDEYYLHEAGPRRELKTGLGTIWRETFGKLNPWRKPSIFRRFEAEVSWRDSKGEERQAELPRFNALVASSLREINPWLKITHRTGERLGCFHGLALNNGFWRTALNLPAMIVGAPMLGEVQDMVTDRMIIRYAGPTRHTIDGELFATEDLGKGAGENSVVIQTGPHIKFVVA